MGSGCRLRFGIITSLFGESVDNGWTIFGHGYSPGRSRFRETESEPIEPDGFRFQGAGRSFQGFAIGRRLHFLCRRSFFRLYAAGGKRPEAGGSGILEGPEAGWIVGDRQSDSFL